MSLTKKSLGDFLRYRLRGGTDIAALGFEPYQIYKWEQQAIDRLISRDLKLDEYSEADLTDAERARAHLYVKPFNNVALVDGVADLTVLAETNNVILQGIPLYGSVNHADISEPFVWVPTEHDLKRPKTSVWAYYTLRGTFLLTRNTDGALDSLQGVLTLFAPQIPLVTEVPRSRHEKLIEIMLEMFAEAVSPGSFEKEAEK